MSDLQAEWQREQQAAVARLQPLLPAFKELYFSPGQLGINGGDPAIKIELAQYLSDTFIDRHSQTVTVRQEVFEQIALRMKGLVDTMTGGTWVQPPDDGMSESEVQRAMT